MLALVQVCYHYSDVDKELKCFIQQEFGRCMQALKFRTV